MEKKIKRTEKCFIHKRQVLHELVELMQTSYAYAVRITRIINKHYIEAVPKIITIDSKYHNIQISNQ